MNSYTNLTGYLYIFKTLYNRVSGKCINHMYSVYVCNIQIHACDMHVPNICNYCMHACTYRYLYPSINSAFNIRSN